MKTEKQTDCSLSPKQKQQNDLNNSLRNTMNLSVSSKTPNQGLLNVLSSLEQPPALLSSISASSQNSLNWPNVQTKIENLNEYGTFLLNFLKLKLLFNEMIFILKANRRNGEQA
jgi:hypothetical protein